MKRNLPPYFYKLLMSEVLSSAFTFAAPLLAPLLMTVGKLAPQQAAWVQAGAYLCTGVCQPYLGHLVDRGRVRSVLFLSAVTVTLGLLLMLSSSISLGWLLFGVINLLLGLNIMKTVNMRALVGEVSHSDRAYASSRAYLYHNLGFSIAAVLAYFFLDSHRSELLVADLVTTLIALGIMYWLLKGYSLTSKSASESSIPERTVPWRILRENIRFLSSLTILWICVFCHSSVTPLIFESLGGDTLRWTALLLITSTVVVVSLTKVVSSNTHRFSERTLFLACVGLYSTQGLTPYFLSTTGVVSVAIFWSTGEILLAILLNQLLYRIFPKSHAGLASGVHVGTRSLGLFLSPLVGGLVLEFSELGFLLIVGSLPIFAYVLARPILIRTPAKATESIV